MHRVGRGEISRGYIYIYKTKFLCVVFYVEVLLKKITCKLFLYNALVSLVLKLSHSVLTHSVAVISTL